MVKQVMGHEISDISGLMGNSEPLSTATDVHGQGLCLPPRMKQNDAVVAELLSILWLDVSEIEKGSCDKNSSSCASFPS